MSEATPIEKRGPVYGVELLESLPLGVDEDSFWQQLPSRKDLETVRQALACGERFAGGYEVLLSHYYRLQAENEEMKWRIGRLMLAKSL